jgi:SAM-dependent methyltransferase
MGEERYFYSTEKDDVELDRLARQASIFDPITIRHFESIGVAEGWRCLEVGAGAGSIAEWLSTRVGPTGKVVATDIDLRFLQRISSPNIEIRRHDILKDDLEKDEYDIAHCRKLLCHLPDPEKALRRMADAIRPGGWLFVEDDDHGSALSLDVADHSANTQRWVAVYRDAADLIQKKGIADCYMGRRLRGMVEQLGFVDVDNEGWTHITRGGDPIAQERAINFRHGAKLYIDEGLMTQDEFESFHRLYYDPSFYYLEYTLFSAWGRKPTQGGGT